MRETHPPKNVIMNKLIVILAACAALVGAHAGTATSGSTVSLNGTFFTDSGGWGPGSQAAPADLVDGVYQPEQHQWNFDSIWWNGFTQPSNNIVLNLGGTFAINDLKVQADNNDTYLLEYLGTDLVWYNAWAIPSVDSWGLVTRSTTLGAPIVASQLRFTATGGDGYYAVSEIEANGRKISNVPDTASSLLLLTGALGLIGALRRRIRS